MQFTVSASTSAVSLKTQTIDCAANGSSKSIPLSMRRLSGTATYAAPTPAPEPTPVPSSVIAATNARLGIDILTASTAQLATVNLPPRPNEPQALQSWLRAVTITFSKIDSTGTVDPDVTHNPPMGASAPTTTNTTKTTNTSNYATTTSLNWTGFVSDAAQHTWQLIEGEWPVAPLNLSVDATVGDNASEWVGLDGYTGTTDLIQDGTDGVIEKSGGYTVAAYYLWYEYLPKALNIAFYVNAEDSIFCEAYAASPTSSTTAGEYWCEDETTGQVESTSLANQGKPFLGESAEWIMERPSVNGTPTGLADFNYSGRTDMAEANATYTSNGDSVNVSTVASVLINMQGSSGDVLANSAFGTFLRCISSPCYQDIVYTWYARE